MIVITSYSIHYTKLYDGLHFSQPMEFMLSSRLPTPSLLNKSRAIAIVITSYSIHYTKLYDAYAEFRDIVAQLLQL